MPAELQVADGLTTRVDQTLLEHCLAVIEQQLPQFPQHQSLCVRLCDETESRALNREYRQQDKPTNVLSFIADVDGVLGDLAICWPVVVAEASAQNKAVVDHFQHLLIHGVLHLLGFDHEHDDEAATMEALECDLLAKLGIANPYCIEDGERHTP